MLSYWQAKVAAFNGSGGHCKADAVNKDRGLPLDGEHLGYEQERGSALSTMSWSLLPNRWIQSSRG